MEQIWNCEAEYSPSLTIGAERQLLKVGEEYGEVCRAMLQHNTEELNEETADLLNSILGFCLHVYGNPNVLTSRLMNAIHKMAQKYSED